MFDIDWSHIGHILNRFQLHFFSAGGAYLVALTLWRVCQEKWPRFPLFLAFRGWGQLIAPALIMLIIIDGREIFDVARGGWVWKSVIDRISWISGFGFSVWSVYSGRHFVELVSAVIATRGEAKWRTLPRSRCN